MTPLPASCQSAAMRSTSADCCVGTAVGAKVGCVNVACAAACPEIVAAGAVAIAVAVASVAGAAAAGRAGAVTNCRLPARYVWPS